MISYSRGPMTATPCSKVTEYQENSQVAVDAYPSELTQRESSPLLSESSMLDPAGVPNSWQQAGESKDRPRLGSDLAAMNQY